MALVSAQHHDPDHTRAVKGQDGVADGEVNLRVHLEPVAWNAEEKRSPAILTMLASVWHMFHLGTLPSPGPAVDDMRLAFMLKQLQERNSAYTPWAIVCALRN
ncbi:unnamed protein product [Nippostrongylus brasiliensis]|uniref:Glucose-6-phosphate isomerase n=1 Tax=Nippostrongylus brasiliensis TaxID=27835 RepID=A0A0N4YKZ5_NIPBR|nr:unnamed protein product [Nippostrongylus brasiliensis]